MKPSVRRGMNEAWFRELNERLELRAVGKAGEEESFEIICECSREECTERIPISFTAYESVRANPRAFLMVGSHVDPANERVLATTQTHAVVEKFGEAGQVAAIENPRSG